MHLPFSLIKRPAWRQGWLPGAALVALLGAGAPADALVINPVFDASWASAPAGATTVVNNVIAEYEADFSNPETITVAFGGGELAGNAQNSGAATNFPQILTGFPNPANQYTLTQIKGFYSTAVGSPGATQVLVTANANLPASYPNPGGLTNTFFTTDTEYLALNGVAQNADAIMAYTGYATNFCSPNPVCPYDFTGGTPPANGIDFTSVVEHKLSHAMSRVDWAFSSGVANGAPPFLTPQDLFRYDCGTANLDPRFNTPCFSYDGGATNPGPRTFSNQSDSGDWINANTDSFNAFAFLGSKATVSTTDILLMCAEGWNDRAVCGTPATSAPEPTTLALLGSSLLGFATLRRRRRQ